MNNNENENDFDASYDEEPASGGTFTLDDIENLEFDDAGENESPAFEEVLENQEQDTGVKTDLEGERDSYIEALRNLQADFENYKKRVRRDQDEFSEVKSTKLITELLGVLDNFELALLSFQEYEEDETILTLKKGIDLVYSDFYSALEKQGLERIEGKGEAFDPEFHEAVFHSETEVSEVISVVEVLRPGYTVRGKVIRPAMVTVSK